MKLLLRVVASLAAVAQVLCDPTQVSELFTEYDYIVVGGGPGGLTVANRLSEDSSKTVLLLEAGPLHNYEAEIMIPRFQLFGTLLRPDYQWNATTTFQRDLLLDHPIIMPQGRVLGGGSSVNVMVWGRGTPDEYNAWEDFGNPGWGWTGLLPYFKKLEHSTPPDAGERNDFGIQWDEECHGFGGPVQASFTEYHYPQNNNFMRAYAELGVSRARDHMCDPLGTYMSLHSLDHANQSRSDARTAYYDPIFGENGVPRPNFHVLVEHTVTKVLAETGSDGLVRATGVEYAPGAFDQSRTVRVKAGGEVIVSGGSLQTPKLLQLSGIGQKSELDKVGIKTVVDLPGVGANLHDHAGSPVSGAVGPGIPNFLEINLNPVLNAQEGDKYYATRTGRWTEAGDNLAFLPFQNYTSRPRELQGYFDSLLPDNAVKYLERGTHPDVVAGFRAISQALHDQAVAGTGSGGELILFLGGFEMLSVLMNPMSRGTVRLASSNAWVPPLVDPRYLSHPADLAKVVEGIRFLRKMFKTQAFREIGFNELIPGPVLVDIGNAFEIYVKTSLLTAWHPAGTAAMLPRNLGGVVDPSLKIYGTSNMRVVDASVMPLHPSAHTMATIYAIAEKAADIIKAENA